MPSDSAADLKTLEVSSLAKKAGTNRARKTQEAVVAQMLENTGGDLWKSFHIRSADMVIRILNTALASNTMHAVRFDRQIGVC